MKRRMLRRRILSFITALVMCINSVPVTAITEESPDQAELRKKLYNMVDSEEYPNGLINFLTPQMECTEGQEFLEFAVVRYGPTNTFASVQFKAIDISARYGEDYYITVPGIFSDSRLEQDPDSVPILEFTADHANNSELTLGSSISDESAAEEETSDEEEETQQPAEEAEQQEEKEQDDNAENPFAAAENTANGKGALSSLASARTALLGVPTSTATWQDNEAAKKIVAQALVNQTMGYYDDMPGACFTINFAPGENMKVLRFCITDDAVSESEEQVLFVLTDAEGSAIDANPTGYMNIKDNEPAEESVYSFEESVVYADPNESYVTATLLRTKGTERYDTVTVGTSALTAVPDVDYLALEQNITFVPGQTKQTVRIPILGNKREEGLTFNLQTRGEATEAAVTVALASDDGNGTTAAGNSALDPADKTGHSFSPDVSYQGLSGSGTLKYRVYRWTKEVTSTASDSIGRHEYLIPASMSGIQKIQYTIDDVENGTPYTVVSDWGHETYFYTGCEDRLGVIAGSTFFSSTNVQDPPVNNATGTLNDTDRTKTGFVLSSGARDGNQKTDLKLTYMDAYVSPVQILLLDPPDEDPDGSVNAYTWTAQDTRGPSFTTTKMGRLGFAGDLDSTTKVVYPDGDATGKLSFVPVYESGITADIASRTYLWGYKILRKAGLLDDALYYYIKGTDFNVNDFMNDRLVDGMTGKTVLHATCGNTATDGDVTYYQYSIEPVFRAKDATVRLSWDDTKLRADKGAFVNGKSMTVGMLDTISYRLISAPGQTELPGKYTGFVADSSVDTSNTSVSYNLNISAVRPLDGTTQQFDEQLNFKLTLTLQDGSTVTRDVTIDTGDELSRLVTFSVNKTFSFTQEELGADSIVSASLTTNSLEKGVKLSGSFEKRMFGRTVQRAAFTETKAPDTKTNFTISSNFTQTFSFKAVDSFPFNVAEPGKFDFKPSSPYTEITAIAGSASIDVRYDPASSSDGKNIGTVLHIGEDGTGDRADPDKGLQIDNVKLNTLYSFNGIYSDEGDGGANILRRDWKIVWKDWTGDVNRDGVISKEEQASLGSYGDKIDRTAISGNTFQFVPIFSNSQIYYSFVKRDPAPDDGRILTVKGCVFLQKGTVLNNLDSRGLITSSVPVEGATVTVDGMSTTTDKNGNFSFSSQYFRSGENYLATISYQGLTYSVVIQVNAFKNIFLEEFKFFTPFELKGYVKSGDSFSAMDLNNPIFPDNADSIQKWTFKLSENVANISAETVKLNLYDTEKNLLTSVPAKFDASNFTWSAEFNPANYEGTDSGTARVLPAGSTMTISVVGSDGVTYPEFEVGVVYKKAISTITVLNTFQTPASELINFIGTLDAKFNLGMSATVDKELKDRAEVSGDRVLISFGINKEFEGQFNDTEEEDDKGGKDSKPKTDSKKADPSKPAQQTKNSNVLDYLKEIAKGELTEGADPKKAQEAVSNAIKGTTSKTSGSVMEGYQLDMGIGLYLSLRIDKATGDLYFDGLIVAAAMLGDVGYKFSMATPIGVTLVAGLDFGGNITGLVAVEPHNFAKIKFDGEGSIDVTKAGDLSSGLDVFGKLFVSPYIVISAGVEASTQGFSAASITVSGKALFDMAFSSAGSGKGSVTMSCELALNVLGIFSKSWTIAQGTWQLFDYNPRMLRGEFEGDLRFDTVTSDDTMDHSYLDNRTEWDGVGSKDTSEGGLLGSTNGLSREETLIEGIYPYANPLIMSIGDKDEDGLEEQIMVFLDTDTTDKNTQNSTRIYYSIFDNHEWSQPQEVDAPDDRLHDDSPNIADLDDRILVVWTSAESAVTDDTNPVDVMNNRNIKGRFFFKDTRTWSDITDITVSTDEDTAGDDRPTIRYCKDDEGNRYLVLTYVKSVHTATGANGEDVLVGDILDPKSELAYRFYDFKTESWVSEYDDATMQKLTASLGSAKAAEEFEDNWYGQNFVDLTSSDDIAQSDPVVTDNGGTGFTDRNGHAIDAGAYIVDMDGDKSTVEDRDIFLIYYDLTANKKYDAIRLTNDNEEQSYISALNTLNGAEIFFLSDGNIKELNVSYLWENLTTDSSGEKTLNFDPPIYTAVAAIDEKTPILEFVVDTDGKNDYLFWTETDISYTNGVEPNSDESSDAKNHLAERHIYGALRAMDDAVKTTLRDADGNVITYPDDVDYSVTPDVNGQIGVVKAGDPIVAVTRTWGSPIKITDEEGANYSDIDATLLFDGGFRLAYLKSFSTVKEIDGEEMAVDDAINRSLCTADFNVHITSYEIEIDPVTALPAVGYPVPITAQVKNTGFCIDRGNLVAELLVSVNGEKSQLVSTVPVGRLASGKSDSVTFEWTVPEGLETAELTARVVSRNESGDIATFYDEIETEYERTPDVSVTVIGAQMVDMNQAEISVFLQNTGDAPANDRIIIASVGDANSMSQSYTLMPGEETILTFRATVPDEAFGHSTENDGSVVDSTKITITSGSAIVEANVTRSASAEDMAIAGAIVNASLTGSDGKTLSDTLKVKKDETVKLGLTAEMTEGFDESLLALILTSTDGTIICNGDSFTASGDGVITAYVVPKGSAALLTAGGMGRDIDILHLISSAALRTITLNIKVDDDSDVNIDTSDGTQPLRDICTAVAFASSIILLLIEAAYILRRKRS